MSPAPIDEPLMAQTIGFERWQNRIQDDMRITAAFAPIDESNSMLYVRYYQRFVRLPLLRWLLCQVGNLGSRVIVGQDRRVVTTQVPKKSAVAMGERLFHADRPIVAYRQRREELLRAAANNHGDA